MKKLLAALALACSLPTLASTWYVRPDGGTRYSTNNTTGQCDGLGDAAYPGNGVNQHCAFNDVRLLWQDGSWATDGSSFPAYGWVGQGGDTYIIRGSIATGVSYRVGWPNAQNCLDPSVGSSAQARGLCGDQFGSGAPTPPSGTATQHTRVLGENWQSCHTQSARTQLHGGYGAGQVLSMAGANYVDVACLDITDFSPCGRVGQTNQCENQDGTITADFATNGITWSNTSTNDTVTDVRIHGMGAAGMLGPTGDGVTMSYLDLVGNPSSGWNADAGDGKTGTGNLLVQNFSILWNGCSEEYPIVDSLPYQDCTDDQSGGYGDGFGTTTSVSNPGWNAHFDQGTVAYNTQDGLDALHLIGNGSSMTITRVLAYGNMGNQLKVGGESGTMQNNVVIGNCGAMRFAIPGTPTGYNSRLSDFCRAGDAAIAMTVSNGNLLTFDFNTVYSANNVGVEVECDGYNGQCNSTSRIDFRDNILLGFPDTPANGNPLGQGYNPVPVYVGDSFQGTTNPFTNPGSFYVNNATFGARSTWACPNVTGGESNAICVDPGLTDETWHPYGYPNATPAAGSAVIGAGLALAGVVTDELTAARPSAPTIGALEPAAGTAGATGTTSGSSSSSPTAPTAPTSPTAPTAPTSPTAPTAPTGAASSGPVTIPLQVNPGSSFCFSIPGETNQACFNGNSWYLQ